jgi:hypothetical protein
MCDGRKKSPVAISRQSLGVNRGLDGRLPESPHPNRTLPLEEGGRKEGYPFPFGGTRSTGIREAVAGPQFPQEQLPNIGAKLFGGAQRWAVAISPQVPPPLISVFRAPRKMKIILLTSVPWKNHQLLIFKILRFG